MRSYCFSVISLALAVGLLSAAPAPEKKDPTKEDQEKIQGTWIIDSLEDAAEGPPPEEAAKIKLVFSCEKCQVKMGDTIKSDGTFKLDATTKMKSIDLRSEEKLIHGIYKLDGDTLTICVDESGEKRPDEFAAKKGTRMTLVVLKRVKP